MDDQKILPSKETIRRFRERAAPLYETPQAGHASRRRQQTAAPPDISEYSVSEPPPSNEYLEGVIQHLMSLAARSSDALAAMRRRFGLWISWLKSGLSTIGDFATSVQNLMPCMFSCFMHVCAAPTRATRMRTGHYFSIRHNT